MLVTNSIFSLSHNDFYSFQNKSQYLTLKVPNKANKYFYPTIRQKDDNKFPAICCLQCSYIADSVDLRSGCTFCAAWSWSILATVTTVLVKGTLRAKARLLSSANSFNLHWSKILLFVKISRNSIIHDFTGFMTLFIHFLLSPTWSIMHNKDVLNIRPFLEHSLILTWYTVIL